MNENSYYNGDPTTMGNSLSNSSSALIPIHGSSQNSLEFSNSYHGQQLHNNISAANSLGHQNSHSSGTFGGGSMNLLDQYLADQTNNPTGGQQNNHNNMNNIHSVTNPLQGVLHQQTSNNNTTQGGHHQNNSIHENTSSSQNNGLTQDHSSLEKGWTTPPKNNGLTQSLNDCVNHSNTLEPVTGRKLTGTENGGGGQNNSTNFSEILYQFSSSKIKKKLIL